eukprot:860462-Heterocapsa_arctica.AAC.1
MFFAIAVLVAARAAVAEGLRVFALLDPPEDLGRLRAVGPRERWEPWGSCRRFGPSARARTASSGRSTSAWSARTT